MIANLDKTGISSVSDVMKAQIDALPDGGELFLPAVRYYLETPVLVVKKKGITIRGEQGTVILTHFTPWGDPAEDNAAFVCRDCEDLVFTDLTFSTDNPVNCAGRVIAKNEADHTYDVEIDDEFPVTGWEHFWGTDTCDEEGTPDYVIETYDTITKETLTDENGAPRVKYTGTKYEVLDGQKIRVTAPGYIDLSRLKIGHRVLYRYLIYGSTVFAFSGCDRVTLHRIEIERCTSMGAVISPRCSDFTFEEFNIRIPEGSHALYSANADGIHVVGLSGYLHMKNCHFVGLGDDALNIHSQAGEIAEYDETAGSMRCIYRNRKMEEGKLGPLWADKDDMICFYDRNTFLQKGTFRIRSYHDGHAEIADVNGTPAIGDILANDSFFASVLLEGCSVKHTRARGFLLQSRNMTVRDCHIYGMALPGIIISPDIKVWYEVGPSRNTEITGCTFEKCAINGSAANLGAIVVKAAHDPGAADYPAGVHSDVRIYNNTFRNIGSSGVFVSATKGVQIYGNRFENCMENKNPNTRDTEYDIVTVNCEDVTVSDNISNKENTSMICSR
ncbi:MAG: right-handed parallel beta-helix repeat-containing protein [Clostridia bacterium]|nr:right-handed parallel beta-helix repeat-containing protein [Clostridia bacterium]